MILLLLIKGCFMISCKYKNKLKIRGGLKIE